MVSSHGGKLYAFFDGIDVTSYCKSTDSSGNFVSNDIVASSNGSVYGIFTIPNNSSLKFTVGTKIFRLTDSSTNDSTQGTTTTSGEFKFTSQGLSQTKQNTIVSTQIPQIKSETVTETISVSNIRNSTSTTVSRVGEQQVVFASSEGGGGGGGGDDPIAQTFSVTSTNSQGYFLTKLDLFFRTKHATLPIIVDIRETENGYATTRSIPYSQVVLYPDDVNVSEDSSAPTTFYFKEPIFLMNDVEYAFVVKPAAANPDYNVWVSRLGGTDVISSFKISEQPYVGNLLVSSNDKGWSIIQDEDIKFNLYTAEFDTSVTGTLNLTNPNYEFVTISNTSTTFNSLNEVVEGETRLTLNSFTGGTPVVGNIVQGVTSLSSGVITAISGTDIRVKDVPTSLKFTSTESVYFANSTSNLGITSIITSQSTPTFKNKYFNSATLHLEKTSNVSLIVGEQLKSQTSNVSAIVASVDDKRMNIIDVEVADINFLPTNIDWKIKSTDVTNTVSSTFENLNINNNTDFSNERKLVSRTNEIANMASAKSLQVQGTFSTTNKELSPILDVNKLYSIVVGNIINNDSANENSKSGGTAQARYISRKVTLDEGQDAEDLLVYLTAYRPLGSDIKVYYKILHREDSDTFGNVSWVEMSKKTNQDSLISDKDNINDFKEFIYNIPTDKLTGLSEEVQYVNSNGVTFTGFKHFMIKIVMLGTNTSKPPRIKDFRSIAIQK